MELTLMHFVIVCPLVFLAGFVDTIAGGGGLISLPAYLFTGMPVHLALGTNKLSASMGAVISTYHYHRQGYIDWKKSAAAILCAFAGSATGAKCALLIDDRYFKSAMLVIIPVTAAIVIFKKDIFEDKEPFPPSKTLVLTCLIAVLLGFYDGIYGPGTGTFLILLLTGAARLKMQDANGTAKAINLATGLSAMSVYLLNGSAVILLGLAAGLFSIAGSTLGAKCFIKGGAKIVKPVMICVLVIFMLKLFSELRG